MQKLTEAFNTISVKKGETFTVELDSNPSTGYGWDLQLTAGKASLVKQDFRSSTPPGSMICGAGGTEIYTYKAEEMGTIELNADYKRSWEKNPPAKTCQFHVNVK